MPKDAYKAELRWILRSMTKIKSWLALHPAGDLERELQVELARMKSELGRIVQQIGAREAQIVDWSVQGEIAAEGSPQLIRTAY